MREQTAAFPRSRSEETDQAGVEGGTRDAREDAGDDPVASLAGEAEDLDRRRVHVSGEGLAQQRAGTEEAGAHGRRRVSTGTPRFPRRSCPRLRASRTPCERRPAARRSGARGCAAPRPRMVASVGDSALVVGHVGLRPFALRSAPWPPNGTTTRSRFCRRSRISAWLITMRVSQVESCDSPRKSPIRRYASRYAVLQRVLGLGIVLEDRARDTEQLAVVAPHERLERRLVPTPDAQHELSVADGTASR